MRPQTTAQQHSQKEVRTTRLLLPRQVTLYKAAVSPTINLTCCHGQIFSCFLASTKNNRRDNPATPRT
jgi:hypothetical protein